MGLAHQAAYPSTSSYRFCTGTQGKGRKRRSQANMDFAQNTWKLELVENKFWYQAKVDLLFPVNWWANATLRLSRGNRHHFRVIEESTLDV